MAGLDVSTVTAQRRRQLGPLVEYVQQKVGNAQDIPLLFICTHNSRRSHLAQIWAQALAHNLGVGRLASYSGGTQVTALHPMIREILEGTGFEFRRIRGGNNPIHAIRFSEGAHPVMGYSKKWDDPFNPRTGFAAVMTCSQADLGCPIVPGAELRVSMNFDDPKAYDHGPNQAEKYRECSLGIATELYYVLGRVARNP